MVKRNKLSKINCNSSFDAKEIKNLIYRDRENP